MWDKKRGSISHLHEKTRLSIMRLSISLATRGRPQQLVDTIRRSIVNWRSDGTLLWVMADADDAATISAISSAGLGDRVKLSVKPREDTIAEKWNRVIDLDKYADLYLVAADDDPYCSEGYDQKLLDAAARFPDGIGMVYGHMANASFSGVVAPTRGLVKALGHIFPTYFPYWFVDHWTDDIARMIDRISFADVRTDQSRAGRTQEMREPGWWATWYDAAYMMRRKIAHGILDSNDFHGDDGWRRDLCRSHHPLIESRSRWVNECVRANSRALEGMSGLSLADARYQRVKQRAIAMIPQLLEGMPEEREPSPLGAWGAKAYREALLPRPLISAVKQWSAA